MPKPRLKITHDADIVEVRFLDKRILDDPAIKAISDQLFALVEKDGNRKMLLNFIGVEYLSSAAFGKLINLHHKMETLEGKLIVCNVVPQIYEVFAITKLDKVFEIFPNEEAALASFK